MRISQMRFVRAVSMIKFEPNLH